MFSPTTHFDWYYDLPEMEPCGLQHKKCGCFISPKAIRIDSGKTLVGSEWETTEAWEVYWCRHCKCEATEANTRLIFP